MGDKDIVGQPRRGVDWGVVAAGVFVGIMLVVLAALLIGPLVLAVLAASSGNASGAVVLLVIQVVVWAILR